MQRWPLAAHVNNTPGKHKDNIYTNQKRHLSHQCRFTNCINIHTLIGVYVHTRRWGRCFIKTYPDRTPCIFKPVVKTQSMSQRYRRRRAANVFTRTDVDVETGSFRQKTDSNENTLRIENCDGELKVKVSQAHHYLFSRRFLFFPSNFPNTHQLHLICNHLQLRWSVTLFFVK